MVASIERLTNSKALAIGPDEADEGAVPAASKDAVANPPAQGSANDGAGIKIGIIDSGIDYKHPALGGCFGEGCKVTNGYDFVGDKFDGLYTMVPDDDPMDECNGHGTHVAGIIGAASAAKTGVAPGATLGAYRVMGCSSKTAIDVIVAAM
ncbi:peptidase S8/S53 domain-containing protein, partial [Syncephalis pseudoplumigaleata]